ncbi:MAG: DNA gyrase subunit A [Anaerolineae bacterium]
MVSERKDNDSTNIRRVDIEQKVRSAYLDYAMSVITARALPDVRDGLKPVQRRILYAMGDMNLNHDQPTKKSARIVGEVLGKYHPHSDTAVYDAMVRMAQDFSLRYLLVEGQGNFGSVDGDGAAAIRYTEARLTRVGEEMLADLEKATVDFVPTYDGSSQEPLVLPAKLPNLLVNGANGIAVGMATNIPPHNLGEVADAIIYVIDHLHSIEDVSVDDLMHHIPGPDFPTGGAILGSEGIRQAYATGKGAITVRARAHVEELKGSHSAIIVTELPYQVNKATLVERIAELVRDGRIEGIVDLRDESDRTGMRVVVELKRGQDAEPVLTQLLKLTQMQGAFGINMLALVDGEPRVMPLKRILVCYIEHRQQVLTRRTQFELEKAQARAHILEGLLRALDHLDEVIQTIRQSRTAETALANLMVKFKFSELQARAILDMQLRRLAALERQKIQDEFKELQQRIAYLQALLNDKDKILALVKQDVLDLKTNYGDARRTRITTAEGDGTSLGDMVPDEESLIVITYAGQVKRLLLATLKMEEGQIAPGIGSQEQDAPQWLLTAHSKETLFFFSTSGQCLVLAAHQVPDIGQQERGVPMKNLVHLQNDDQVAGVLAVGDLQAERYLTFITKQGKIKRLILSELAGVGAGSLVIGISEGDSLLRVLPTGGKQELLVITARGRALRFKEDDVRPQGRSGSGIRAISLAEGDEVIGAEIVLTGGQLLVASEQAYAKRCPVSEFSVQGRGGQGVMVLDADKLAITGNLVASVIAPLQTDVLFVTRASRMVRRPLNELPELPRTSWGRLVSKSGKGAVLVLGDDTLRTAIAMPHLATPKHKADAPGPRPAQPPPEPAATPGNSAPLKPAKADAEVVTKPSATPSPKPQVSAPTKPAGAKVKPAVKTTPAQKPTSKAPVKSTSSKPTTESSAVTSPLVPLKPTRSRPTAAARPVAEPAADPRTPTQVKTGRVKGESGVEAIAKPTQPPQGRRASTKLPTGPAASTSPQASPKPTGARSTAPTKSGVVTEAKPQAAAQTKTATPQAKPATAATQTVTATRQPAAKPSAPDAVQKPPAGAKRNETQPTSELPTQDALPLLGSVTRRDQPATNKKPQRPAGKTTPRSKG